MSQLSRARKSPPRTTRLDPARDMSEDHCPDLQVQTPEERTGTDARIRAASLTPPQLVARGQLEREWTEFDATRPTYHGGPDDWLWASISLLAGHCDGARMLDGIGFNGRDAEVGRSLADQTFPWTEKQRALAYKIAQTYRRTQLAGAGIPVDLLRPSMPLWRERPGSLWVFYTKLPQLVVSVLPMVQVTAPSQLCGLRAKDATDLAAQLKARGLTGTLRHVATP